MIIIRVCYQNSLSNMRSYIKMSTIVTVHCSMTAGCGLCTYHYMIVYQVPDLQVPRHYAKLIRL